MNRSDLVARIRKLYPLLSANDVNLAVNTILDAIRRKLASGGRVEIRNFGTFLLRYRKPKLGRNPQNGDPVNVPGKFYPAFRAGNKFKRRIDK